MAGGRGGNALEDSLARARRPTHTDDEGGGEFVESEYAEWLERVHRTYESVRYTCAHRLGDPVAASSVAVQVTAGLVARPRVFRYFGLPYSGRIASLAEGLIAEAGRGVVAEVCSWAQLESGLLALPKEHRRVIVAACVRDGDTQALARELGCDEQSVAARVDSTLQFMREVAAPGLPADGIKEEGG
jgi:hypothetical protein